MTKIVFHSNVADKFQTLAYLLQKALQKRHRVTVLADSVEAAQALSQRLWQHGTMEFMPNALATQTLATETPIVLHCLAGEEKSLLQDDILINLTFERPASFSRFREVVELVGEREEDKIAARARYKFYRDCGYEIQHIDQQTLINV